VLFLPIASWLLAQYVNEDKLNCFIIVIVVVTITAVMLIQTKIVFFAFKIARKFNNELRMENFEERMWQIAEYLGLQ
jgi:hypothetical protein